MRLHVTRKTGRAGSVAPLTAVLLIPLVVTIAFAVDLGYLVVVQTELQDTADCASLAGARQLMEPYPLWMTATAQKDSIRARPVAPAKSAAKAYPAYNRAGGVSIALADADIEVGYLDSAGNYNPNPPLTQFPNSVRVVARRDKQANTPVPLFFASVIGNKAVELKAAARATVYTGQINSFSPALGLNARLLPMTYDIAHWENFVKTGKDPDGNTSLAADGNPQLKVYPSIKYRGNFGELALDDAHAGASEISGWIDDGLPPSDLHTLIGHGLIPLSQHDRTQWDWR